MCIIRVRKFQKSNKKGEKGMKTLKFKAWLVEHNIRQGEVADLLNITFESANAKINGRQDFTLPQVKTLCVHYGLSADEFFI